MEIFDASGSTGAGAEAEAAAAEKRRQWLAVLAGSSVAELETLWQALPSKPAYRVLRPGETGLIMVRGRIGGNGGPFNFGEMTMTRAAVQLVDPDGGAGRVGFGHVAGRSIRHAELIALCDALLQDPARHDAVAKVVLDPLAARQQAAKAAQAAKVAASKVDFFTLVRGE
jgi:alpha-D-ribose 1-methylphosphonate 5-triphosphate synthase subunit PhnG